MLCHAVLIETPILIGEGLQLVLKSINELLALSGRRKLHRDTDLPLGPVENNEKWTQQRSS